MNPPQLRAQRRNPEQENVKTYFRGCGGGGAADEGGEGEEEEEEEKEEEEEEEDEDEEVGDVVSNMDVCSGFMAAVVTGRYTTSGHLTSFGIGVGVGAGPVNAELFRPGSFHSRWWWRRMERVLDGLWCQRRRGGAERDSSPRKHSHHQVCEDEQGLMGDLLSGVRVKEGC
ncbi:unnamed protein product [Pleuronectes platessa]|uniref:Uncharacterized protein n=1 Tax=Pleuronectes platessa TaxID=8262 RepID=A0A9N7YBT9_PLEPL|nr:unnamed protein product [Pleuronectes platessa]